MTIFIAADHAGFELKEALVAYVKDMLGHEVVDCGAHTLDAHDDYPAFMRAAAEAVAENPEHARAILIGGSGQGEAIVANRTPKVRAALYYGGPKEILTLSREHNDANALSLGSRFMTKEEAFEAVALWLTTPFSNEERHLRRIRDIDRA